MIIDIKWTNSVCLKLVEDTVILLGGGGSLKVVDLCNFITDP